MPKHHLLPTCMLKIIAKKFVLTPYKYFNNVEHVDVAHILDEDFHSNGTVVILLINEQY